MTHVVDTINKEAVASNNYKRLLRPIGSATQGIEMQQGSNMWKAQLRITAIVSSINHVLFYKKKILEHNIIYRDNL